MNDFKFVSKLILLTAVLAFVVVGFSFLVDRNIDNVTIAFLAVTVIVPTYFVLRERPAQIAANFASTMGVLGTFVGVFMGLLKFNTSDIQASVPPLLEGLKTAFLTSIVGMIVSMLIKLLYKPKTKEQAIEIEGGDKMAEMMTLLVDAVRDIRRQNDEMKQAIVAVPVALTKIDDDVNNGVRDIEMKIQHFGEIVAEQSSKELISAIQKVMEDFNAKINDQLGESFNDLTESCRQLNEWQQQHIVLLSNIRLYTEEVKKNSEDSVRLFDDVNAQIVLFRQNEEMLQKQLHATAFMLEKAQQLGIECKDIIPDLQSNIQSMVRTIKAMVADVDAVIKEESDLLTVNSTELKRNVERIQDEMHQAMSQFSGTLINILREFNDRSLRNGINNR